MAGNILIIGAKDSGEKNNPDVMRQQLAGHGLSVDIVYWEVLVFDISHENIEIDFDGLEPKTYELVIALGWYQSGEKAIYRDVAFTLALYLSKLGVPFWNSEMLHQRSTTKLSTIMQLALEGIEVPRTIFSLDAAKIIEASAKNIEFPAVAKAVAASRGRDNHLVQTPGELKDLLQNDPINKLTVQPFLPNDHDLRIICFNNEPHVVMKRSRTTDDTHLNNTSQGGKSEQLPLEEISPELLTKSRKICKIMGRELAGIDFLPSSQADGGYVCLEVNAIPQLTSGSLLDQKMESLAEAIKKYSSN
jgi:glutathione synthase/RimK-type ligase-like ATP-grasp enzyme